MLSLYRESKAPIEIDLGDMLKSILLLMDRRFNALGATVEQDLAPDLIIHGFPAELRQVFTNLLTNAAEASGPSPALTWLSRRSSMSPPGTVPHTSTTPVSATNPAPSSRSQTTAPVSRRRSESHLFKPFFTTKGERGTGLGLWVSRGIMTKHGGTIDLASSIDPADHGTTVSVFLATDPVINAGGD